MSFKGIDGHMDLRAALNDKKSAKEEDIDEALVRILTGETTLEDINNQLIEEFGAIPEKKPEAPQKKEEEEDIIALANQGKVHIHLRDDAPEKGHIPDPKDKYPRITLPREEPRQEENNPIINFFRKLFRRR